MYGTAIPVLVAGTQVLALTGGGRLYLVPLGVLLIIAGLLLARTGKVGRLRAELGIEGVEVRTSRFRPDTSRTTA